MASIFITGGCGFVGSNLAVAFRKAGADVTVLDNLSRKGSELLLERVRDTGARYIRGDIRNPEDLDRVPGEYDALIECSAEPSVLVGTRGADARFMLDNNLVGALNCFEWARSRNTPVIFLSTSRVYPYDLLNARRYRVTDTRFVPDEEGTGFGPGGVGLEFPMQGARSLYGATKWAAEIILQEYAKQYDLPAVINRCGVIAGPWQLGKVDQGVFTHWLVSHLAGKPLTYIGFGGKGKQVRDLLHIQDLTDLIVKQVDRIREFKGALFQAGGSVHSNLSLCETTELCRELTASSVNVAADPLDRPADVKWLIMDNGLTETVFDWRPTRNAKAILSDIRDWLASDSTLLELLAGAK